MQDRPPKGRSQISDLVFQHPFSGLEIFYFCFFYVEKLRRKISFLSECPYGNGNIDLLRALPPLFKTAIFVYKYKLSQIFFIPRAYGKRSTDGQRGSTAQEQGREPIRERKTDCSRGCAKEQEMLRDRYFSRLVQILRYLCSFLPA
jgi:hypothetical protein